MTDSIPPAENPASSPSNPQPPPQPRVIEVTAEVTQSSTTERVYEMPPSTSAPASTGNVAGTSGAAAGAPPPSSPPPAPPSTPPAANFGNAPRSAGNPWAMACHLAGLLDFGAHPLFLGLIASLVVWLIKKDESAEVDWHGKEAINFQISLILYWFVSALLVCCLIGLPLLAALWIAKIVLMIYAAVRAASGERWRYPLTLRFIR